MGAVREYKAEILSENVNNRVRENVPVDIATYGYDQTPALLSGRFFRRDTNGEAVPGGTSGSMLAVAIRGVECADVAGGAPVYSSSQGTVNGETAGKGKVVAWPCLKGYRLLTTEYAGGSYTRGASVALTSAGKLTTSGATSGNEVARITRPPRSVNNKDMLEVRIV